MLSEGAVLTAGLRQGPEITVDARMLGLSGIGVYIRNVLPRIISSSPEARFHLIGRADLPQHPWARAPGVDCSESRAPIYSVVEQIDLLRRTPAGTDLFWSPHYNVPLLRRGRLLATIHDLAHIALPELVRGRHRRAYARFMLDAAGRASATIFVSRFTADEYARIIGRSPRCSTVIHQGVDESWFQARPSSTPPHPQPYLLFVGNVKPHKNLLALLRAFASLQTEISHDLLIVGKRSGFIHGSPAVEKEAQRLAGRVHFTGWVDDEAVRQFVANAAALVFPSFYEGFGLPPLEAMACGCPVVAADIGAVREVCGDAVLYCDPNAPQSIAGKVRHLLQDAALRGELVAQGRERARSFTWQRCAAETAQVIDRAINS